MSIHEASSLSKKAKKLKKVKMQHNDLLLTKTTPKISKPNFSDTNESDLVKNVENIQRVTPPKAAKRKQTDDVDGEIQNSKKHRIDLNSFHTSKNKSKKKGRLLKSINNSLIESNSDTDKVTPVKKTKKKKKNSTIERSDASNVNNKNKLNLTEDKHCSVIVDETVEQKEPSNISSNEFKQKNHNKAAKKQLRLFENNKKCDERLANSSKSTTMKNDSTDDEAGGDTVTQGQLKKRRRMSLHQREAEAQKLEASLREIERAEVSQKAQQPQSEHDYERMLLSNSSCSATWIHYISYMLSVGNGEKARALARRALSVIPFEEQKELLNVWTVLLRLEFMTGNPAAVEATLVEACNNCDDFTIRTNMAAIYEEQKQFDKAEAMYVKLRKKYFAEKKAWEQLGLFYYKLQRCDQARDTLTKGLVVLNKKHGVEMSNRFAQMELKFGDRDKSKIMFESLLNKYPKRLDIWNVYTDLFCKHGDIDHARSVLSRMCSMPLKFSKRVAAYKKWQRFEEEHGTDRSRAELYQITTKFADDQQLELDGK